MTTLKEIEQDFGDCTSEEELRVAHRNLLANDRLLCEANERRKAIQRLKRDRSRAIEADELAPFEDEAKRMQRGQKVYFERRCEVDHFGFDLKFRKGARVEAGEWCRVWQYQPKAKRLWLCRPGTPAKHANVMNHDFSLRDMKMYGISRTEIALRK